MKLNTIPLLSRVLVAAAALQGVSHAASPWVVLDFSTPWTLAPGGGGVGTTWTKTGVDLRPGMPDMTATFTITGIGGGATLDIASANFHHPWLHIWHGFIQPVDYLHPGSDRDGLWPSYVHAECTSCRF